MFDNTNAASLELLRFRSPLAATAGFEQIVRERVKRLARFDHPAFPPIRAVEHLDDGGGLALVSTHVPGRRLSEMFQSPQPRTGLHPASVTWLIRQLTSALAALQSEGDDVFHGAMGADRIVVSGDGHLLIAEHVLGSALQSLRLTPSRLFHEFGIFAPATKLGVSLLDARSDVVQLGITSLSVLLGRQLTLEAFQQDLGKLLHEFASIASQRSPFLAPPLRVWLERALQYGDYSFRSAAEARDGLKELPEATSPRGFSAASASSLSPPSQDTLLSTAAEQAAVVHSAPAVPAPQVPLEAVSTVASPATANRRAGSDLLESRAKSAAPAFEDEEDEDEQLDQPFVPVRRRQTGAWLALGFAVIALVEAAVIRQMLATAPPAAPPLQIPVLIESPQNGDLVLIDGRQAGTTPVTVSVGEQVRAIRIVPAETSGATADSRPDVSRTAEGRAASPSPQPARARPGGIRLVSPIELQVYEGDRLLGSSAAGPVFIRPGVHDFVLINADLGYRTYQRVNVTEGQVVPVTITPPSGRVNINAIPWAQVWIDGRLVGESPLSEVPLAAGVHTITFRHPDFGERRETVTVRPGGETRVTATLRQP
jgi:hypothetical protein